MIYLDNSATTRPEKAVADKVYEMLTQHFGNASSFHKAGLEANLEVRNAREALAKAMAVQPEEIYFTSGGTEANNLAIFSAAATNRRRGNRIVTTAIEHESVLQSINELEKQGFEVIRLKPDKSGSITEQQLYDAVDKNTILVSMMYINNEVGSILPVKAIRKAVVRANAPALVHIDCVQAFGKVEVKPAKLGADFVTVTAHKIHGPKGIGALYIKKGTNVVPRMFGGEQEKRIRPGTESTPLIAGFGEAVKLIPDLKKQAQKMREINAYARQRLLETDGIRLNSSDEASDYIINAYIPTFMTSQTVVQHLSSQYDIYVSNGSACAKGKKSHVLTEMALPDDIIERSIRISFSRDTQISDIDALAKALDETIKKYPR